MAYELPVFLALSPSDLTLSLSKDESDPPAQNVMRGLDPRIHVDGRVKPGHDALENIKT